MGSVAFCLSSGRPQRSRQAGTEMAAGIVFFGLFAVTSAVHYLRHQRATE